MGRVPMNTLSRIQEVARKIPKGTIAGVLMAWGVPEALAEGIEVVSHAIMFADDPLVAAQRAATAAASKVASDAIIDAALDESTNVNRDTTQR